MNLKLIVGLGNFGRGYEKNRHNAGFMAVDNMVMKTEGKGWRHMRKTESDVYFSDSVIYAKPRTMMNLSGRAVKKLTDYFGVDEKNLFLIYDDLDIRLGSFKIQKGKGPKGHNGVLSVCGIFDSRNFWHVRIGIENRKTFSEKDGLGLKTPDGEGYVLRDFSGKELDILEKTINKVWEKLTVSEFEPKVF